MAEKKSNLSKVKEEDINLSEEELSIIESSRKTKERRDVCLKEIRDSLEQYNCELIINPQSPFNNLQIIVVPK